MLMRCSRFRDRVSFRFLGIRYGPKPPRFGYSSTFTTSGSYSALSYGADCLQLPGVGSEDCLFLNIFTPYLPDTSHPTNTDKLKPVLLYIHGGGFISGTGSDPEYDGGNMASRGDVVVVTINYRLGPFGFLPLNDTIANGNYGLADQITALNWVRANIVAFGGDRTRITIAGQSAGAASVHALLGSPEAVGNYSAAMPMSNVGGVGVLSLYSSFPSIAEGSILLAGPVLAATGCAGATSQIDCLRSADAQVILGAGGAILPSVTPLPSYIVSRYDTNIGIGHLSKTANISLLVSLI
jgi:carboxylesterase type B